jgi:predicted RNA binding protein YcfA (HicA-like mRNA interferase family)
MPRKVKDLEKDLIRAGFERKQGKGSHRKYRHPRYPKPVIISGQPGADAKRYQETEVRDAIEGSEA